MNTTGRLNSYRCDTCEGLIVTIDRDEGVTPFMLRCRVTEKCGGSMTSSFYKLHAPGEPTWEWRKPTEAEIQRASTGLRGHYEQGGLLLAKISQRKVRCSIEIPAALKGDERAMVLGFAEALAEKFVQAEQKHGWNGEWKRAPAGFIQGSIVEHLAKGDPRDVAVLCAIAYARGFPTASGNDNGR